MVDLTIEMREQYSCRGVDTVAQEPGAAAAMDQNECARDPQARLRH